MKISVTTGQLKFYLLVSVGYLLLSLFYNLMNYPGTLLQKVSNNIWAAAYILVLNFIFFEHTIPFIRRKRKTIFYNIFLVFVILPVYIILYSFGLYAWRLIGIWLHIYTVLKIFTSIEHAVTNYFAYSAGSIIFFGIAGHIYNHIKLTQAAKQLRIEKQEAELNYLKSQTNPHFLFNTLNNIYSLARDKSDLAPETILRLSKILRFMLYETGGAFITIEQELKIISDYIALERLRYDESLRVNFNHNIEDTNEALPPLLLIPLVENAFKHGVSETRNQPFVDIYLSVNQRQLMLVIKNSFEASGQQSVKENIGLSNLRRQLELLYTDHDLSVKQAASEFTATLKINLASHV